MNVAVADNSPLGQYLAELDALDGPSSATLAAQLKQDDSEHQATEKTAQRRRTGKLPHQPRTHKDATTTWRRMRKSAQRLALEQLLRSLDDASNIRDAVLDAAGVGSESPLHVRCWLLQMRAVPTGGSAWVVVAGMVGVCAFAWAHAVFTVSRLVLLCVLSAAALEFTYQALVVYYSFVCRRLIIAIRAHSLARSGLQTTFSQSLDVVKRSELVARGYRLGRVLPPIGRLEEASSARSPRFHLQCRRLRLRLRDANDALEHASRAVSTKAAIPTAIELSSAAREDSEREAPSLLVSALIKRHELSSIMLESALRDALVDDLAQLVRAGDASARDSFAHVLSRQANTYEALSQLMSSWSQELSRWHARLLRLDFEPDVQDEKPSRAAPSEAVVRVPREVTSVSHSLLEFQTSCDTLAALAVASQHDIVDCIAASARSATGEGESVDIDQVQWLGKLQRSREQMTKLIQQLKGDWDRLERTAYEATSAGRTAASDESQQLSDERVVSETQAEDLRDNKEAQHKSQQDAERDYLLVFTATSTGEKDFDLQELLRQQRLDEEQRLQSATAPIPSFMGELQNVLEQRTALPSAPVLVKRIGDEVSPLSSQPLSQQAPPLSQQPPPHPEPVVPRGIDLQQLLQSRFTAQLHEESVGLSSGEEDDE